MTSTLVFDPLVPWSAIVAIAVVVALVLILGLLRNMAGTLWRGLGAVALLMALSGPVYQQEDRAPLDDIVLVVEDQSASQNLATRAELTGRSAENIVAHLKSRPNTQIRRVTVGDGPDNSGSLVMGALAQALAELPRNRVAGAIILSDGIAHDPDQAPEMPAPMHLLHTGLPGDWDRRLIIENAPGFGILDEEITVRLQITDDGAAPETLSVPIDLSLNGGPEQRFTVTLNTPIEVPLTLSRGGRNVLQISTPAAPNELTDQNNTALISINGIRDRLRVLLVSGEPYQGERTWRNLLKSDSSVDLVHFTILRPPEKQDGVPVHELSLIAFPTRELFMDKIEDFDLIIFDRYKRRGILPGLYLENVRFYIENGGAVLIAAGPDFAGSESLYRTPLREALPGAPTAKVLETPFLPKVTETGQRHPVTEGLQPGAEPEWGRWLRQVELEHAGGEVVMSGVGDSPLLLLDRVGEGRVALLASDQAWLWHRGFEGGGPQMELLRRLAHWLMKEPELEEEALWAEAEGQKMRIIRRSLTDSVPDVTITTPSGEVVTLPMQEVAPGRFETTYESPEIGLYLLENAEQTAVMGMGPASPLEYQTTIANTDILGDAVAASGGGVLALADGVPTVRTVRMGARAFGRGWIGLPKRGAYETKSVSQMPLLPPWLALLLVAGFVLAGWLREGRR